MHMCVPSTPKSQGGLKKASPLVTLPLSPNICSWYTGMTAMVLGSRDYGCSLWWKARQNIGAATVLEKKKNMKIYD